VLPSGGVRGGRPGARLSYLSAFVAWPVTMQGNHGYGGLVSDSGEGARVKATTSKRRCSISGRATDLEIPLPRTLFYLSD
jgi:hypothetical protein